MCSLKYYFIDVLSADVSQMKAVAGLKMSYQVQQAIKGSKSSVVRGFRHDDSDSALCSHLYTLVRGNRQHRRAFLISLLNLFDDSSVSLCLLHRLIVSMFSDLLLLLLFFLVPALFFHF